VFVFRAHAGPDAGGALVAARADMRLIAQTLANFYREPNAMQFNPKTIAHAGATGS